MVCDDLFCVTLPKCKVATSPCETPYLCLQRSRDLLDGKSIEKACVIPSDGERKAFLEASASAKALLAAAAQNPLHFGRDIYIQSEAPLVDDVEVGFQRRTATP